jgi:hypothetical protein
MAILNFEFSIGETILTIFQKAAVLSTYCINELSQHYFVINQLLLHISSNKKQKSQSVSFSSFLNFVSIIISLHITLSNNKQFKREGELLLILEWTAGLPQNG